VNSGIWLAPYR